MFLSVSTFTQTPPPQPNPGDPYDSSREVSHIQASQDTQEVLDALIEVLDQYPPTLITDASTGLLYYVLGKAAGNGIVQADSYPYQGIDVSDTGGGKVSIGPGTHNNFMPTIGGTRLQPPFGTAPPVLSLGSGDNLVYVEVDFTAGIVITSAIITSTSSGVVPANSISGGVGSIYQALFGVTVVPPAIMGGSYSVQIAPLIRSSQVFSLCGDSLVGPYPSD